MVLEDELLVGVTGAAGFIGMHLVMALRNSGFDVVGLDNFSDSESGMRAKVIEKHCRIIEEDILNVEGVSSAFQDAQHVFHLAAETHVDTSLARPLDAVRTNALGTASVLEAARKLSASLTYVSTDEVFGDLPLEGDDRFTGDSIINPSSPYSSSKAAGELLAKAWARSFDMKVNITNCGNNYGEYQSIRKFIPRTMTLLAASERPVLYGSGANVRDWIHVSDHASALVEVMINGEAGKKYLIGVQNSVSNRELMDAILSATDRNMDFVDLVEDRPGHDLRYEIKPSTELVGWGWKAEVAQIEEQLPSLWQHYRSRFEKGELEVSNIRGRGLSS